MSNGSTHGELVLFDCPRVRRPEYWQFIRLVAPAGAPPAGQTHWLSQDASDAFCLRCSKLFRFQKGSSNSVRRHMERFHRKELARHQAAAQAEAAALAGASRATRRGRGGPKSRTSDVADAADADPAPAKRPRPAAAAAQREGEELLVRWLCAGLRPLSVAQDAGLAALAAFLSAGGGRAFQLPPPAVTRHRLELSAEGVRFDARQALRRHAGRLSLSVELWSVRGAPAYAAVVAHLLSENFERAAVPLEVAEVAAATGECEPVRALAAAALRIHGLPGHLVTLALAPPSPAGMGDQELRQEPDASNEPNEPDAPWFRDVLTRLESELARCLSAGASPEAAQPERDALAAVLAALVELQALVRACAQLAAVRRKLVELRGAAGGSDAWVFGDHDRDTAAATEPASWADWARFLARALAFRPTFNALFAFASTTAGRQQLEPAFLSTCRSPAARTWRVAEAMAALLRPLRELRDVLSGGEAGTPCVAALPFMLQCLAMVGQEIEHADLLPRDRDNGSSNGNGNGNDNDNNNSNNGSNNDNDNDNSNNSNSNNDNNDNNNNNNNNDNDNNNNDDNDGDDVGDEQTLAQQFECVRAWVVAQLSPWLGGAANLRWCSPLDPRCARMRHLTAAEREASRATLVARAAEMYASQLPAAGEDPLADFDGDVMYAVGRAAPPPAQGLMHRLLYDDDDDVAAPDALPRGAEAEHARLYAADEVDAYLAEHQARKTRVACPLEWWRANRDRYPLLAPLARVWLGAVVSTGWPLRHILSPEVDAENRRRGGTKVSRDMILVHLATRQPLSLPPSPSWPAAAPPGSEASAPAPPPPPPPAPPTPPFAV